MPNKRISELPIGVLGPNSILPIVSNGVTSQVIFSEMLTEIGVTNFITGATYNPSNGTTTFYLNDVNTTFDVSGYFTGYTYTPEDIANKQNSMTYDGSGIVYPTVDAVNELVNNIARATINTGFITPSDTFIMERFNDTTLHISGSSVGIIFKSLLETPPFVPSTAILNVPETTIDLSTIPLSALGITNDGIYIKFIGFSDESEFVFSNASFKGSKSVAQLGVLILKVNIGLVSFLDAIRNVTNLPSICSYSNFELSMLGLESDITVRPNDGTMTVNNSNGSLKGVSVKWHGLNNDVLPIPASSATSFTQLSQANALTTIPPVFTTTVITSQYWNGSSLVDLSTSSAASIQRWIVTINGRLALQYGEQEYASLEIARDNMSIASFSDILPNETYVEIARMAAISGTTDLSDTTQVIFNTTFGAGGGDDSTTVWGTISGDITQQTDLYNQINSKQDKPTVLDLGTATTGSTNIQLSAATTLKLSITGDTNLNFIPQDDSDGKENTLILKLAPSLSSTISLSSNIVLNNNTIPNFTNLDGVIDLSFLNTQTINGFNNNIQAIAIQSGDSKVIVGGNFTSFNSVTTNRIIRLNADGTRDNTFNFGVGFNNTVSSIVIQSDDKILVGGLFSTYNGITASCFIRLNTDGTVDTSFSGSTSFNSTVQAIAIQSGDSKIIVGGNFTQYSGISSNRIIRLNTDGTRDNTFNIGTGFNNTVLSIELQSDGKILVGGDFTQYSGTSIGRIIRLNTDGSVDTSFSGDSGFNNQVKIIKIKSDNILVGGSFTFYKSVLQNNFIQTNSDGTNDTNFIIGTGFNNQINSITTQPDNQILVGGNFTQYNGVTTNRIIRLNTDGSRDNTFNIGTGFNANPTSIAVQSGDSKIIIGGGFSTYSGITSNGIIRLNSNGSRDNTFNIGTGFNAGGSVFGLTIQPDSKIIAVGTFTLYSGISSNRIIRLNSNGSRDNTFNIGTGFNGSAYCVITQPDAKIIVGGDFTQYSSGTSLGNLIRLNTDGTIDSTFKLNPSLVNSIHSVGLQSDGKIIVGGGFSTYSGISVNDLVRLNTDGTVDTSFATGGTGFNVNSYIYSLVVQPDDKIVCGGQFTSYNGQVANYHIRLNPNGSIDNTYVTNNGFIGSSVNVVALQSNNKTLVGGTFTQYGGFGQNRFSYLTTDGSINTNFSAGTGFNNIVNTINILSFDKILIGGNFTVFNGISNKNLISLNSNGTVNNTFNHEGGTSGLTNSSVNSIVLQTNKKIIIGGGFITFNNITQNNISRLNYAQEKTMYFNLLQDNNNIILK